MRAVLTVAEAADALGTSPQTVRTMLRKGQLRGEKRPWGSRYVWEVSTEGLEEFLAQFGRLDGGRRPLPSTRTAVPETVPIDVEPPSEPEPEPELAAVGPVVPSDRLPVLLRPRGRATVMVVVLGIPLVAAHVAALTLPGALWFHELDQGDVYRRLLAAKLEFRLLVALPVAAFVGVNLAAASRGSTALPRRAAVAIVLAASTVAGVMFASAAGGHWQTFVLWRHRQTFGAVDPLHAQDLGFFVFSLPFELLVSTLLLWMVAVTAVVVAVVLTTTGELGWRPRRATFRAQVHLASLGAVLLLVVSWRLHLAQYVLELHQPSRGDTESFAGADYTDVHVRMPGLALLACLCLVLAVALLAAPVVLHRGHPRTVRLLLGVPLVLLVGGAGLVQVALPALVQRFVVEPSPLLREQPYLGWSIAGTRAGLGLDRVSVQSYAPTHTFHAADFASTVPRLRRVQIWDSWLLGARMRQLVSGTPYFKPEDQVVDVDTVDGRRQPTVVSARELDLSAVRGTAGGWTSDRLAYTHGLGLIRFSGTDTGPDREPRLLDSGLGLRQPRIYFGNFTGTPSDDEDAPRTASLRAVHFPRSTWVLVDTRRAEVDTTSAVGTAPSAYHYTGPAGISLSSRFRRAVFALSLHSKQLWLSHDITPSSRILLHRDVHDRLHTLAPFIQWDASAVPLTEAGHVVFVVDGYTTSSSYPFARRVYLGGSRVSYARPSVVATVDAFTGRVEMYLTDPEDPLIRAWAEAFPTLFRPADAMSSQLGSRLRYPPELFDAQAAAYQTYHATDPSVFASDSDVWSRPIALSGGIEVAGGVDFDHSDEDDLRLTMQPSYTYSSPPGRRAARLVLATYYVPRRGQNLVATLNGWVDPRGRPRLTATNLPRDPVTLGPAQISRLVFATPRVSNLLGLRNLEVGDLDKSSIDSVILGRPHLLFLSGGVMQIQSLYEGSRGPGAARLLGVTAYINGSAGLGPDIGSAVRQALNQPPELHLRLPPGPVTVGQRVSVGFRVANARRETITIRSPAGRQRIHRRVVTGAGQVWWVPRAAGATQVRVEVLGLDGTVVARTTAVHVLGRPPTVRLIHPPARAVVGRPLRIPFVVRRGHHAVARVSTRSGIVFSRRYVLPRGRGLLEWTPESPGRVTVIVRARGRQRQTSTVALRLRVRAATGTPAPPAVELLHLPRHPAVGVPGTYSIRASGCREAVIRIRGQGRARTWRFPCPVAKGTFSWTPVAPGAYRFTTTARAEAGVTTSQKERLTVSPAPGSGPSSAPTTEASRQAPP